MIFASLRIHLSWLDICCTLIWLMLMRSLRAGLLHEDRCQQQVGCISAGMDVMPRIPGGFRDGPGSMAGLKFSAAAGFNHTNQGRSTCMIRWIEFIHGENH